MKKQKKKSRSKEVYHLKNWSEYDKVLVNRFSLTLWISDDVQKMWNYSGPRQRGGQYEYSDTAIETMLTIKELFHLTNRGTEGFVSSLFELMGVDLSVPDHTTISTRGKTLNVEISSKRSKGAVHILVDSSGLKVYGEGEWKVRKHGYSKRRTWRKLHLMVEPNSHEIIGMDLTQAGGHDSHSVEPLLDQLDPEAEIESFTGDGGYDTWGVYDVVQARAPDAKIVIPPQKNAKIKQHGNCANAPLRRDETLRAIRKSGRKKWKQTSGYHQRSLVETGMYRFKTIFDEDLTTRSIEAQTVQARVRCKILNTMTALGMPDSCKVAV